tara:strand:- start:1493 stop:2896 length:1404 start_codon:yes stop_codon:yes gene_type:complete
MKSLGSHIFSCADLEWFASASGDFNPMHVDPIYARRLITGKQTVHGMFLILLALENYYLKHTHVPSQIKAFFQKPTLVGDEVEFFFERDNMETTIFIRSELGQVASILMTGEGIKNDRSIPNNRPRKQSIKNNSFSELKDQVGKLTVMALHHDLKLKFPNVSLNLGSHSVATIMSFSKLVGMSIPGLHSIFTGFKIKFGVTNVQPLSWRVTRHISPNAPIQISLEGENTFSQIDAFMRPAPVIQPSLLEVQDVTNSMAYAGQRALIIGGSRGLGELVAKFVVAGSGNVCITYANGKSDAIKIQTELNQKREACKVSRLNVTCLNNVEDLLRSFKPTHLYYFATPPIRNNNQTYNSRLYQEYVSIFVDAFTDLVRLIASNISEPIHIFYPSTIFIESTPRGFSEYTTAKKVGEAQCKILEAEYQNLQIHSKRLPPMNTDQTSSLTKIPSESALGEIHNLVTEMNGWSK